MAAATAGSGSAAGCRRRERGGDSEFPRVMGRYGGLEGASRSTPPVVNLGGSTVVGAVSVPVAIVDLRSAPRLPAGTFCTGRGIRSYPGGLRAAGEHFKLGVFSLEKRRLRGDS